MVIFISAVVGGGFAFVNAKLNKINRVDSKPEEVVDPSMETFETEEGLTDTMDVADVVWNNADIDTVKSDEVHNILLIGQDRRPGEGRQRSDSMIICTLNTKTNKIILTE